MAPVGDWIADLRHARARRHGVVRRRQRRSRRAHIEILRDYDIVAVPVEDADSHAAAVLVTVGTLSRGFRLADAALQIYAETDVFEEERRPRRSGAASHRRFCPTCAISRLATSWSMWITGLASSSD